MGKQLSCNAEESNSPTYFHNDPESGSNMAFPFCSSIELNNGNEARRMSSLRLGSRE